MKNIIKVALIASLILSISGFLFSIILFISIIPDIDDGYWLFCFFMGIVVGVGSVGLSELVNKYVKLINEWFFESSPAPADQEDPE